MRVRLRAAAFCRYLVCGGVYVSYVVTRLSRPGVVFRWRGKGLLSPLTSDWRIVELDADYQWAVISFSRSLFTPAGLDIIAREPVLPEPVMRHVRGLIGESDGLVEVAQN